MSGDYKWQVGQRVVLNGRTVETVERVTPSGRAIVCGSTYGADGWRRGDSDYTRNLIVPATDELLAKLALRNHAESVYAAARRAADRAERYARALLPWGGLQLGAVTESDVEKAERLTAAINAILQEGTNNAR